MLCCAIKGPSCADVKAQIEKALVSCDLVELRLDCFESIDEKFLHDLRSNFNIPMIFTLRDRTQGGNFQGGERERLLCIEKLSSLKPEYLDIEAHVPNDFVEEIQKLHPEIKIILSFHDFEKTPKRIDDVVREMKKKTGFLYKIALFAQDSIDMMRLVLYKKNAHENVLVQSMGSFGAPSRIMGPSIKNVFTFACLEEHLQSAPGQITCQALSETYNHYSLHEHTELFGLIGDSVEKSISHLTHNFAFKAFDIPAVYVKMNVIPSELSDFLPYAKQIFRGLSVTMPLKEAVLPYLDYIDEGARSIGAVNTLLFKDGKILGYNTDGSGCMYALENRIHLQGKNVIVLGAGGAAKAIIYYLCTYGAHVTILNRDQNKAKNLAQAFHCLGYGIESMKTCAEKGYDCIINCTPLSMPCDPEYILPNAVCMDITTKPMMTEFLQCAQEKGCTCVYGYEMFVEQALGQFSLWFSNKIDVQKAKEIMKQRVNIVFESQLQ